MGQQPVPHHNYADEYMGSAKPYVKHLLVPAWTGGPDQTIKIEFPSVTRFIILHNNESTNSKFVQVAFYENGFDNDDFMRLSGGLFTRRIEIKCKNIWLRASNNHTANFCVMAACTNIPRDNFPDDLLAPTSATENRINKFTV